MCDVKKYNDTYKEIEKPGLVDIHTITHCVHL